MNHDIPFTKDVDVLSSHLFCSLATDVFHLKNKFAVYLSYQFILEENVFTDAKNKNERSVPLSMREERVPNMIRKTMILNHSLLCHCPLSVAQQDSRRFGFQPFEPCAKF